jgi:hypothetical protein
MRTRVELLGSPPVAGSLMERHYHPDSEDVRWVRFSPDNAADWAGAFAADDVVPYSAAFPFADESTAFVVAGGRGYVVDIETGELRFEVGAGLLEAAIPVPERPLVAAADSSFLMLVSPERELHSEYVALDGIRLLSATPDEVAGELWDPEQWYPFRFRLADHALLRDPPPESSAARREPWWKR